METFHAEIITIGNEILSGRTVNTNASHIARRLTSLGFKVRRITVVMDEINDIAEAFTEAISREPAIIVSTGGLGPTYDDKTSEGLAKALGVPLTLNENALNQVKTKYLQKGIEITQERMKMAMLPLGAEPVENYVGIAPGIYMERGMIEILSTPGVPKEMEAVLEVFISKFLKKKPSVKYIEANFEVKGIMESALAPFITQLVKKYDLYIKTHPKGYELSNPMLEIQIAGSDKDEINLDKRISYCKEEIKEKVKELGGLIVE
ncbi:damage-inducible protein CinA [Candidatus Acidianus copahuensis]|uniref:Protein CM19_10185 n=1 Tax=Candidatus Acidianus copahuensis TaxID=1160895 RepID=A0A031LMR5_9CREN|nr:nicotinamide mononucleotide deamidase-related protein [Candidatus Acidianus copahuensis]EZQ03185.1 damage-inducible protein CinA [Candidatus Acidianus copahuensis]